MLTNVKGVSSENKKEITTNWAFLKGSHKSLQSCVPLANPLAKL